MSNIRHGTDLDVTKNLQDCAKQIREIAYKLPVSPVNDFVGFTAQRTLIYVASEIGSAPTALRNDIKQFAWRTRNIFEALLIIRNIILDSDFAEAFCALKIQEEKTILDKILKLAFSDVDYVDPIVERTIKAREILTEYGFDKIGPDLAKGLVDLIKKKDKENQGFYFEEYEGFYKLYSKYVHPSAWTILSDSDEFENETYWEILILNSQTYAHRCRESGLELLGNRALST